MKFKTSTLALSATLAAGLASSAFADTTPTAYEKLVFTTNQIYKASVENSTAKVENGAWNTTVEVDGSKIVIDSDSDVPLTFTPTVVNSVCNATELKFNVEASFVPATVDLAPSQDALCGFAIKLDDTATPAVPKYWLYNGTTWVEQSAQVGVESGKMFDLTVRLDGRAGVKTATYFVGTDQIGTTSLGEKSAGVAAIDFVGNGSLGALRGDRLEIIAEVVPAKDSEGKDVVISVSEEAIQTLKAAGKDPNTFLADTTKGSVTKLNNLERFVLMGKTEEPTAANQPKIVAKAFPTAAGKLAIQLDNLAAELPQIEGAKPKFVLEGSDNKAAETWNKVDENETGKFEFAPDKTGTKFKFYRVKASVDYTK